MAERPVDTGLRWSSDKRRGYYKRGFDEVTSSNRWNRRGQAEPIVIAELS